MTIDQFDKTGFQYGDKAVYKGETYPIKSLDFEERLIGLLGVSFGADEDDVTWVRCESVEHIPLIKEITDIEFETNQG